MIKFDDLDTDEPLARRIERHAYDRLINFADGVFAFAATLLALEVRVPPHWDGRVDSLITTDTVTRVISYVISFMVVAVYWMGNRRLLAMFQRVDGFASFLCIAMLMLVALLPTVSQTLMIGGRFTDSILFYVGYVTLIGWMQGALWAYGAFIAKLVHPSVGTGYKWRSLGWMMVVPTAGSGLTIYASRVSPGYGYLGSFAVVGALILLRHYVLRAPSRDETAP